MLDDVGVRGAERDAFQVANGIAGVDVPGEVDAVAVQDEVGAVEDRDGGGVVHLAEVEADEDLGLARVGGLGDDLVS